MMLLLLLLLGLGAGVGHAGGNSSAWFRIDFDTLHDPAWPAAWAHYKLLVCTPRFSEQELAQIKRDVPGAQLLAYFDTQFAMIDKGCASSGNSPYYQAVNHFFQPEWAITDLSTGLPVCLQPHKGWAETRPAGFVPMPASADAMARYHKEVTFGNASSWDGLYLDDSQSTYSPVFAQIITAQTHSFDIDGDGRADNVSDLNAQLMAFQPYYFAKLREAAGPKRILIGNSGPPFGPDPSLNGIAIEAESCHAHSKTFDDSIRTPDNCAKAYRGQRLVSHRPAISLYWHTEEQVRLPSCSNLVVRVCSRGCSLGGRLCRWRSSARTLRCCRRRWTAS